MRTQYPDDFMFNIFDVCSDIYKGNKRTEYIMLSSGANYLPMTDEWKELSILEIKHDFMINWYTSPQGFPCLNSFNKLYVDFLATKGQLGKRTSLLTSITGGGSQAAAIALSYISCKKLKTARVLSIGPSYSLYERLARKYSLEYVECLGEHNFMPSFEDVYNDISYNDYDLVVITIPNNPTGEAYEEVQVRELVRLIKRKKIYMLIDIVPQLYITRQPIINIEAIIYEEDAVDHIIIVNSYSKTEGVPGFRAGYLCGCKELIDYATDYQMNDLMNPATFPIFPIIFTMLYRLLYVSEMDNEFQQIQIDMFLTLCRQIVDMQCAIPNQVFIQYIFERLKKDIFIKHYKQYVNQQLERENVMISNLLYTKTKLEDYISVVSNIVNGFNIVIKLNHYNESEEEFIKNLVNRTGVSVLTESCFDHKNEKCFYIRCSLALDPEKYERAIDLLADYLESFNRKLKVE